MFGGTTMHRRVSSSAIPVSTSPHIDNYSTRSPRLDANQSPDSRRKSYSLGYPVPRSKSGGKLSFAQRIPRILVALAIRLSKSHRALFFLVFAVACYLTVQVSRANTHVLARAPVPNALLPLIHQSGHLLHHIAPSTGKRVQSWSYDRMEQNRPLTEQELEAQSMHTFHPNGLLLVNPRGRHPILVLIERAEEKWNRKVQRQSKTLHEAVREYKHRYRRNPPAGFDDWWQFCEDNNVKMRDEYDQIQHDLAPHRALEPHDSRHRNRVMQDRDHTFTLALTPGHSRPTVHGEHAKLRRATDVASMLALFQGRIPKPVNLTFIIDDNPAVMLPYAQKDRMVELSEQGEYFGPSEFVPKNDPTLSYFAQACSEHSSLRRAERQEFTPDYSGSAQRSFIWDHSKAVDLCQHPEFRHLHGHTMQQGVPLGPLVPLFTFAKTKMHSDILVTPLEQYSDTYIGYEPPWEGKTHNKLLWRGTTTGVEFDKNTPWRDSQRARLHIMSHEKKGEKEVIWSQRGAIRTSNMTLESLNNLYMDTAFAGKPEQCDPETCEIMRNTIEFQPTIGLEDSNQYKYMMDVDGNGWSGRFHRLMSSRSLVFKSTIFPEWYHDRLQPWVHYVPIKVDYSDLYDALAFFIGTPDGQGGHDSIAEKIGENGRKWAQEYWRREDMAAYMYRLILEYSRILHADQDGVDYIDPTALSM